MRTLNHKASKCPRLLARTSKHWVYTAAQTGFVKAVVSWPVGLRECPFREVPLYLVRRMVYRINSNKSKLCYHITKCIHNFTTIARYIFLLVSLSIADTYREIISEIWQKMFSSVRARLRISTQFFPMLLWSKQNLVESGKTRKRPPHPTHAVSFPTIGQEGGCWSNVDEILFWFFYYEVT